MKFFSRFSLLLLLTVIPVLTLQLLGLQVGAVEMGTLSAKDTIAAPLAGGWSASKLDDPMVLEAADFCLQALRVSQSQGAEQEPKKPNYSFTATPTSSPKVIRASQQVVAGMNFQLTILVQDADAQGDSDCLGAFTATVYNRFGDLAVTKWDQEYTCAEAKAFMEAEKGDAN